MLQALAQVVEAMIVIGALEGGHGGDVHAAAVHAEEEVVAVALAEGPDLGLKLLRQIVHVSAVHVLDGDVEGALEQLGIVLEDAHARLEAREEGLRVLVKVEVL